MKRLTLIRHAKSSWSHPEVDDFDRPLNKRGEKDAPMMGKRLAHQHAKPDLIISSPAHRAISTAIIMAQEIRFPIKAIVTNQDLYAADVSDLMRVLQQIDDTFDHVMVVGHNPGLTSLSYYLTQYQVDNIPTCGVVCIDCAIDS